MQEKMTQHINTPPVAHEDIEQPEDFWKNIEEDTRQGLLTTFAISFEQMKRRHSEEEVEEEVQKMIEREHAFVTQTLSLIEKARTENPQKELVLLFDIDETIATVDFDGQQKLYTILRPSLKPLLEHIVSDAKIKIGFITTRGKEAVEKQLTDLKHLELISVYIDPQYIYSSRGENSAIGFYQNDEEFRDKYLDAFVRQTAILDEQTVVAAFDDPHDITLRNSGNIEKLSLLKRLQEDFRDKVVVIVDDIEYPKSLNQKNGFYGLSLTAGKFYKP